MLKHKKLILGGLLLIAFSLFFYRLGNVPSGMSIDEVRFGLKMASVFGNWVLNPFWVRLPNVLFGILTVFIFFICLRRLKFDIRIAFCSSFILSITPWFIGQSRIYSLGIYVTVLILLLVIILTPLLTKSLNRAAAVLIILSFVILTLSIFRQSRDIKVNVDVRRTIVSRLGVSIPPVLITNKFIESFRYHEKLLFENLDLGNYFFKGHPRERGGVEETQKLLISFLPLIAIGLFKIKKEKLAFLFGWWFLSNTILTFFEVRNPSLTLILLPPITVVLGYGVAYLVAKKRYFTIIVIVLFIFIEIAFFLTSYFSGNEESLFTPRRTIYASVVPKTLKLSNNVDKVVVSVRLRDPRDFFYFYSKGANLENFEFKTFDARRETDKNALYVDVLPDEPSPSEPLYKKEGNWLKTINVLAEFRDENLRQQIIIFKLK
jgi:hypothetical protein